MRRVNDQLRDIRNSTSEVCEGCAVDAETGLPQHYGVAGPVPDEILSEAPIMDIDLDDLLIDELGKVACQTVHATLVRDGMVDGGDSEGEGVRVPGGGAGLQSAGDSALMSPASTAWGVSPTVAHRHGGKLGSAGRRGRFGGVISVSKQSIGDAVFSDLEPFECSTPVFDHGVMNNVLRNAVRTNGEAEGDQQTVTGTSGVAAPAAPASHMVRARPAAVAVPESAVGVDSAKSSAAGSGALEGAKPLTASEAFFLGVQSANASHGASFLASSVSRMRVTEKPSATSSRSTITERSSVDDVSVSARVDVHTYPGVSQAALGQGERSVAETVVIGRELPSGQPSVHPDVQPDVQPSASLLSTGNSYLGPAGSGRSGESGGSNSDTLRRTAGAGSGPSHMLGTVDSSASGAEGSNDDTIESKDRLVFKLAVEGEDDEDEDDNEIVDSAASFIEEANEDADVMMLLYGDDDESDDEAMRVKRVIKTNPFDIYDPWWKGNQLLVPMGDYRKPQPGHRNKGRDGFSCIMGPDGRWMLNRPISREPGESDERYERRKRLIKKKVLRKARQVLERSKARARQDKQQRADGKHKE